MSPNHINLHGLETRSLLVQSCQDEEPRGQVQTPRANAMHSLTAVGDGRFRRWPPKSATAAVIMRTMALSVILYNPMSLLFERPEEVSLATRHRAVSGSVSCC